MFSKIVSYFIGTFLTAIVGLLSSAVFTRLFTKAEYGNYSLVMSFVLTANVFTNQWIQQAISRSIPLEKDSKGIRGIKETVVFGICVESALVILLTIFAMIVVIPRVGAQWRPLVVPMLLYLAGMNVYCILAAVLQAEMHARIYSVLNTSNAILKLVLGIACVLYVRKDISLLLWTATASVLLFIPVLWKKAELASPFSVIGSGTPRVHLGRLKDFAAYGVPMTVWYLSANLLSIGDRYVIQSFRGASEVGIYSANYTLIGTAVGLLAMPVLFTAHPFLMKAWSRDDRNEAGKWLGRIMEGVIGFGALLVTLTWAFSGELARWFLGPEFREGHRIMPVIAAGVVFWQLGLYAQKPMEFVGDTRTLVVSGLLAVLVNFAANLLLVPRYGYAAAAYTTLLAYFIYFVVARGFGRRILPWRIRCIELSSGILPAVGGIAAAMILRRHFEGSWGRIPSLSLMILSCGVISLLYLRHAVSNLKRPIG